MQELIDKCPKKCTQNTEKCTEDHTLQHTDSRAHMAVIVSATNSEHPRNILRINSVDNGRKGAERGLTWGSAELGVRPTPGRLHLAPTLAGRSPALPPRRFTKFPCISPLETGLGGLYKEERATHSFTNKKIHHKRERWRGAPLVRLG